MAYVETQLATMGAHLDYARRSCQGRKARLGYHHPLVMAVERLSFERLVCGSTSGLICDQAETLIADCRQRTRTRGSDAVGYTSFVAAGPTVVVVQDAAK